MPGQRNGVSRDCFQPEGISQEALVFSVEAVGWGFFVVVILEGGGGVLGFFVLFCLFILFLSSPAYLR